MTEQAQIDEKAIPMLDPERRDKVFEVAKHLRKNTYYLTVIWLEDTLDWALNCTCMIDGLAYDAANHLDKFSAKDHADLFRMAMTDALKQHDEIKARLVAEEQAKQQFITH
ncbi:MAG: hypothetical protein ACPGQQ_02960 [Candidatus Puniceispirillaceae bacterium]